VTGRARLSLPEGAVPTPAGYCAACGSYVGAGVDLGMSAEGVAVLDQGHAVDHPELGVCRAGVRSPEDPARTVRLAVLRALQDDLQSPHMPAALAARVRDAVEAAISAYTAGGDAS
jgi:hypothetical protein